MKYNVSEINENRKKRTAIKKIILAFIYILLIPIVLCDLISVFQLLVEPDEHPNIFGYKLYTIISGSMTPTINKNDIIIAKVVSKEEIGINDIVTYKIDNEIITHRVMQINNNEGYETYTTKGDANDIEDEKHITYNMIEGKYCFRIKNLGKILMILQKKSAISIILTILITLYLYERRLAKRKIERKKVREHYEKLNKS